MFRVAMSGERHVNTGDSADPQGDIDVELTDCRDRRIDEVRVGDHHTGRNLGTRLGERCRCLDIIVGQPTPARPGRDVRNLVTTTSGFFDDCGRRQQAVRTHRIQHPLCRRHFPTSCLRSCIRSGDSGADQVGERGPLSPQVDSRGVAEDLDEPIIVASAVRLAVFFTSRSWLSTPFASLSAIPARRRASDSACCSVRTAVRRDLEGTSALFRAARAALAWVSRDRSTSAGSAPSSIKPELRLRRRSHVRRR